MNDHSILIPLDPRAPCLEALEVGGQIALQLQAAVDVIQILPEPGSIQRLADMYQQTEPIRTQRLDVHIRVLYGDPASLICTQAQQRRCSWVVMGLGSRVQPGPVARTVVDCSPVPVVLVAPAPELLPAAELQFSDDHAALELIGRMQASGAPWTRLTRDRIRTELEGGRIQTAS